MSTVIKETSHITTKERSLILWFNEIGINDIQLVGGKNASLGEMIQQLTPKGVNVPMGFATTAYAYRYFIESAGLEVQLRELFADLDVDNVNNLRERGKKARSLLIHTPFPPELRDAIAQAYQTLCQQYYMDTDVAVRSSATAEDLPDASFAGQQETYLNVTTTAGVLAACHKCFASLFTDRAISYRHIKGFDHFNIALAVGVQKMVRSDLASAGVMFTIETETGFKDAALITAAYGLGENVVQGAVNPDEYYVFKPTLKAGFRSIIDKKLGSKELKMIYDDGSKFTKNVLVTTSEKNKFALTDDEILQLGRWACLIEDHYSQVHGVYTPMDIEWAKDGITNDLFVVQARPETVQSQKSQNVLRTYRLRLGDGEVGSWGGEQKLSPHPLVTGRAVGSAISQGKARVISEVSKIDQFQPGEVLVTDRTDPDWEPIMKHARAIITNSGGRTCHAAIIARELGVPAIVGCGNATEVIKTGQEVTVSCAEGEEGKVYPGLLPFDVQEVALEDLPRTRTQILMNVGNPQEAFSLSAIPNDGVGLARTEFIIANHIQTHPMALIKYDQVKDQFVKEKIGEITALYDDKPQYFVDKLAQGIGRIAAAFYPKPVIVRMSDFKSNEYANLLGGRQFEPKEENPMLGWRGAARYYDQGYREAFALECQAIKRVREEMGLVNIIPMIPFCRTPDEGRLVLAEMAKNGLKQGENGLQVYVMCELPNNVIMAEEFAEVFDGFSIGSNDLTQLALGIDRDSALVARLFDERSQGVKRMVKMAIAAAKKHNRKIGICGQAPSDYPEFAQFLVEQGIDSISLNPDSVLKTMLEVAKVEGLGRGDGEIGR
ncbi:phosphoenolpyruvate synthase [Fischerella thermalis]|uniref:phosphoenolpyruvate synthase n=1 Tax=Fischerella thermalis TaxID=372787 RepID=UPI000C80B0A3|nr:phosphoenolpyruvate synthase [Fischerella thermalis]MBF1991372.1 phosphoenolpyruvate synthase [Fischerella thermalis M58_A2018_009]MBF2062378.1 phosphoenolpyruvate synthase [Fischerella thermalis M66_A2018_004]MBF2068190.1 phosphoenolpyruvate synthase [Fischerella thermalis M48_A2018_028]PLZ09085.1 phosphoenolpyruvate synthase [Fischerella thermalis WC114]PLZ09464.1 phosphoenolpyruvate synthase [Fischerella thermalis WC1110]